jgi:hypothetical protein
MRKVVERVKFKRARIRIRVVMGMRGHGDRGNAR